MKHLQTKKLIRELAKKHKLTIEQTEDVISAIPAFVKYQIINNVDKEEGYYPSIGVPYFGTFFVSDRMKHILNHIYGNKSEPDVNIEENLNTDESI